MIYPGQLTQIRNKTQKSMLQDVQKLLIEGISIDTPTTEGVTLVSILLMIIITIIMRHCLAVNLMFDLCAPALPPRTIL